MESIKARQLCWLPGLHSGDNVLRLDHRLCGRLHLPVQLAAHWIHPRSKLNRHQIFQGYQYDLFGLKIWLHPQPKLKRYQIFQGCKYHILGLKIWLHPWPRLNRHQILQGYHLLGQIIWLHSWPRLNRYMILQGYQYDILGLIIWPWFLRWKFVLCSINKAFKHVWCIRFMTGQDRII